MLDSSLAVLDIGELLVKGGTCWRRERQKACWELPGDDWRADPEAQRAAGYLSPPDALWHFPASHKNEVRLYSLYLHLAYRIEHIE
jgi:hypothetical protein